MTKLKYRVYDVEDEKMYPYSKVNELPPLDFLLKHEERFKVMYFMGFIDEQNREIYQGDVIFLWWSDPIGDPRCDKVEMKGLLGHRDDLFIYMNNAEMLEIQGNIYEK